MSSDLFEQIIIEMQENLRDQKVVLACSTGVDSMVLFDLLRKVKDSNDIIIAHVNHQKREESKIEEKFIDEFAKASKIKCYIKQLPHYDGNNFQSWARDLRYEFFLDVATKENASILLLAHHADDNLETILLRLMRNSSLEGYGGIRKYSKYHSIDIYRPMLSLAKDDILEYAKNNSLKYFDDSSNSEDDYARNRIRHHVVPILKKENPSLLKAVQNYSTTLHEASDFIENYETNFIKRQELVNNSNEFFTKVNLKELLSENEFLQEQILFRLLKRFSLSKECIKDIIKQIKSNKDKIVKKINEELLMIKEYGYVIFTKESLEDKQFFLKIDTLGIYNLPNNQSLEVKKNICYFNTSKGLLWYNIEDMPLIVRTRIDGDKIKTKYGTISISNYLTNKKVPYLQRKQILLLCNNENKPLAILGYIIK